MFPSSTRREFLKYSAASGLGLIIGFDAMGKREALAATARGAPTFAPNAFVRVGSDGAVTVVSKHLEHGVGIHTGLATLVAEELDADWSHVRVVPAPANVELYKNLLAGTQDTRGSSSLRNSYEQYRKAGAVARAMLVSAAAANWDVPVQEISIRKSVVMHVPSGHRTTLGKLAEAASVLPVPGDVVLKDRKDFTLIGNETLPRTDTLEKTNGQAQFGIDVTLPDMLIAVVAHSPRFGGKVRSFDASKARALPGVVDVVQISTGVAVLANSFWVAQKARDTLHIEWDDSDAETRGTDVLHAQFAALLEEPGRVVRDDGNVEEALARASRTVTATYELPYLAHAPLEPVACVARLTNERCEIWTGDASISSLQEHAAGMLGLKSDQIEIHSVYAGGHFGRRTETAMEVVEIVKAIDGRAPVKLQWNRAEELQNVLFSGYRRMSMHKVLAGLDSNGDLTAYKHRVVGQASRTDRHVNGVDSNLIGSMVYSTYEVPNFFVDGHVPSVGIPVCPYRGDDSQCYVIETFMDEVAHAAGRDPVEFRRALLTKDPRNRGVLELAAEKAGWGTPLGPNRGRGIAVHDAYYTAIAQVAEVTAKPDGTFKVDRVVCAINCGLPVNPGVIRAQIEGAIAFSLGAALHSEITLKDGVIQQTNFHDYPVLRIDEMPTVEVHFVSTDAAPTGVGEPPAVVTSAAVANAMFAASGKRYHRLPWFRV